MESLGETESAGGGSKSSTVACKYPVNLSLLLRKCQCRGAYPAVLVRPAALGNLCGIGRLLLGERLTCDVRGHTVVCVL